MFDTSSSPLGSVVVEVKANLDQLVRDFSRARSQTTAFANDLQRVAAPTQQVTLAQQQLSKQLDGMIRQYQPLTTARAKFAQETAVLNQAEQAGLISFAESSALQRDMAKAMESTTLRMGEQRVGLYGWARETEHHLRAFRLLLSFVGVDLAARLGEFAVKTLQTTAAIKQQAEELGLTTAQLQEYRAIAPSVGLAADDMDKAFKGLDNSLGEIALHGKSTQAAKLFKALGVSVTDTAGQVKSRDAIFKELINRLGQVHDKTQQTTAASIIFGEAGKKMGQLIGQGSAGVDKLREAVRKTGAVLSDRQIQDADEAAKKLDMVKTVLSAEIASTVSNNAQAITGLANALAHLTGALLGFLNSNPQLALGFLGALGGAFLGGPYGAAAGFAGGVIAGDSMQDAQIAQNTQRRKARLEQARQQVARLEGQSQPGDESILGGLITVHHGNRGSAGNLKDAKAEYARLQAQDKTASAAEAAAAAQPPKKGPNIDLKNVLAHDKKGKEPKFDTFEQDMEAEKLKQLQLEREATGDLLQQNEIDKKVIGIQLDQELEKIKKQVHSKSLTAAEAKQLTAAAKTTALMETEAADRKLRIAQIEQQAQYATEVSNLERDGLQIARSMARTDDERKRLDLAILDSTQQQAVSDLQTEIAKAKEAHNAERVAQLTEEMAKLRANQLNEIKQFGIDHLLGIDKFKNDLPKTLAEFQDAIHHLSFDLFNQKLQEAAQFANDIGGAFGKAAGALARFENPLDVLRGLLSDLAATFTKNFIEKPVSDWITAHVGVPLAKQGFGSDLDKLAKAAGGTALTTTEMNTALASATVSLTALTAAANAAAAAMASSGAGSALGGGGGLGSLLGGGGGGSDLSSSLPGGFSLDGDFSSILSPSLLSAGGGFDLSSFLPFGFAGGGFTGSGADHEVAGAVHKNEYVWDAPTTRQWMPVLQLIGSGKLPSFQGPGIGQMMGRGAQGGQPLTVQFGDVHLHGVTDERIARQSANQFMSHVQRRTAQVVKKGLNN